LRWLWSVPVLVALGAPVPARAAKELLAVDPAHSEIALQDDSSLAFGFPGGIDGGAGVFSAIGTPGSTLPSGLVSDGRRTSLSGSIFVDLVPGTSIGFASRATTVTFDASGSFLPGLPAAPATPAPANLAVAFSNATLGLTGKAALRSARLSLTAPSDAAPAALTPAGSGTWTFAGPVTVVLLNGVVDGSSSVSAATLHGALARGSVVSASGGTVEDLPGGRHRVTLPFDAQGVLPGSARTGPVPTTSVTLHLAGQLVAATPAPEPDARAAAATAAAVLALRARRRSR
jgi:hypothetical protein